MKIDGAAIGASLFAFTTMLVPPTWDINTAVYGVQLIVLGVMGVVCMHIAFREGEQ